MTVLEALRSGRVPRRDPLTRLDEALQRRLPRWAWRSLQDCWRRAWAAVARISVEHDLRAVLATEAQLGAAQGMAPCRYRAHVVEVLGGAAAVRPERLEVQAQGRHVPDAGSMRPMVRADVVALLERAELRSIATATDPVEYELPGTHSGHVLADYVAHDAWASLVHRPSLPGLLRSVRMRTGVRAELDGQPSIHLLGEPASSPPLWLLTLRRGDR